MEPVLCLEIMFRWLVPDTYRDDTRANSFCHL